MSLEIVGIALEIDPALVSFACKSFAIIIALNLVRNTKK